MHTSFSLPAVLTSTLLPQYKADDYKKFDLERFDGGKHDLEKLDWSEIGSASELFASKSHQTKKT